MIATLYTKSGEKISETNCVRVSGIEGGFQKVTLKDQDAMGKALGTAETSPHFITNMTLHADGVETGWGTPQPGQTEDTYQVSLHDEEGIPFLKWKGCVVLNVLKGSVYFWHDGRWHMVTGDIIAEMEVK